MLAKAVLVAALAALAAAQSAVLSFTRVPNPVTDGEPQAIIYATNDSQSPVTIILRKGNPNDLETVATLTTDSIGGQFIWTPPLTLENDDDYALEIRQNDEVNYYGPFTVQGASPSAIASASSSASSSSSGSVTASANMTMTSAGTVSLGTGTTMSRNTTMSRPTLTRTSTETTETETGTSATSQSSGASFQGGSPTGGSAATSTPDAAADLTAKGSSALLFGALAALFYLC